MSGTRLRLLHGHDAGLALVDAVVDVVHVGADALDGLLQLQHLLLGAARKQHLVALLHHASQPPPQRLTLLQVPGDEKLVMSGTRLEAFYTL